MRKQIGIKLPEKLIDIIDNISQKQFKNRTQFIEDCIRNELNRLKINTNILNKSPKFVTGNPEDWEL